MILKMCSIRRVRTILRDEDEGGGSAKMELGICFSYHALLFSEMRLPIPTARVIIIWTGKMIPKRLNFKKASTNARFCVIHPWATDLRAVAT